MCGFVSVQLRESGQEGEMLGKELSVPVRIGALYVHVGVCMQPAHRARLPVRPKPDNGNASVWNFLLRGHVQGCELTLRFQILSLESHDVLQY